MDETEKLAREISPSLTSDLPDDFLPVIEGQVRRLAVTARQIEGSAKLILVHDGEQTPLSPSEDFDQRIGEPDPSTELSTDTIQSQIRLTIKKPDLLGRSQWEFRLGRTPVYAPIKDSNWLSRFHSGEILIRPGDMLDCYAQTTFYKENGLLVDEKYEILRVDNVHHVPPSDVQDLLIE